MTHTSTEGNAQRMADAYQRMLDFERKYSRSPEYPHLPILIDLVEYAPDLRAYREAQREFWQSSRDYIARAVMSEAV